jgi:hypothetical protein
VPVAVKFHVYLLFRQHSTTVHINKIYVDRINPPAINKFKTSPVMPSSIH